MRNTGDALESRPRFDDSVDLSLLPPAHPLFRGSRLNCFDSTSVPAAGATANDLRILGRHNWDR